MANRFIKCAQEQERIEAMKYGLPLYICGSRFCEFCFWRESRRMRKKYYRRLLKLIAFGYRVAILTLTVPNLSSISAQDYDRLFRSLRMLLLHKSVKGRIFGGIAKMETTYNSEQGEFHPHIHIIIVYKACISWKVIAALWITLTMRVEDYEPQDTPDRQASTRSVRIRRIRFDKTKPASVHRALSRTIGYICKFNPISDPEAFVNLYKVTKGQRLVRAYGGLRKRYKGSSDSHQPLS